MKAYDRNWHCEHVGVVWIKPCSQCTFARFSSLFYNNSYWLSCTAENYWLLMIKVFFTTTGDWGVLLFELWLDETAYEIFICGLLQGRHTVKKALIWQAKQTLMRPDNQWRHWWRCVVALGSKRLDMLTVNNEWGDSWLISAVVALSDTQPAFQWSL